MRGEEIGRKRGGVDLDADTEQCNGAQRRDHRVELQRVGPQLLVSERVEAKDRLAIGEEITGLFGAHGGTENTDSRGKDHSR
jgi:hypothetical protein